MLLSKQGMNSGEFFHGARQGVPAMTTTQRPMLLLTGLPNSCVPPPSPWGQAQYASEIQVRGLLWGDRRGSKQDHICRVAS